MAKNSDSTLFAFLAVFLSIIGFIIALVAKRDDKYVMFYAKQSLAIFITAIIINIVGWFFMMIPFFGWMIRVILGLGILVIWVITWIAALSGTEKEAPIVGSFVRSIKL